CIYLNLMILIKIIRGFIRAQHALLIAISSDLNAYGVVCEFDWNDGNGQEGWPPMDGSEGIRITDIDTSGIFDSDDMTIKAA
ncbi:DUF2528 family protein, partial [Escherichia coli]|nr:DUF2528 family protein [Escherichia coli]